MPDAKDAFRLILRTPWLIVFTLGTLAIVAGLLLGAVDFPRTGYGLIAVGGLVAAFSLLPLRRKTR